MSLLQIVCQNCGAKYRLPETFSGDRAKCKACGSVIDVAAQRDPNQGSTPKVAAQPAKARPAAAKPAAARAAAGPSKKTTSQKTTATKAGASKATARAGSRRAAADDEDDAPRTRGGARRSGGSGGRRSAREAEPAKNNNMLIFGGLGLVAIVVILVVALGGGDDPKDQGDQPDQTARNTNSSNSSNTGSGETGSSNTGSGNTGSTGGNTGSANSGSGDGGTSNTGSGDTGATNEPGAGDTPSDTGAGDTTSGSGDGGTTPAEDEVENPYDPRTELEPIAWPDAITAEEREEAEGWVEDLEFGGFAGINAKKKLTANYWVGTFAVLNKLRTLDLSDADQVRYGDDLTRHFTEQMIAGIVVPWRNVNPSETPSNNDRDRNGRNVKALFDWANRALTGSEPYLATKDAFIAWVEKRREQRDGG